ncbi:hypothetical protein AX774_g4297 [Zancudomyces culisetae]|uniref:Uncharacterized protein n=1 Tax=Zancudomyces culisetae TaxID=1213189 RepID=A0A1R1PMN8_ZANCU|nr:hypothetical protein AX774_g5242 [Zancudomyces culisetae]OMH82226.1 hypothetical protein AX774_g4297 [Zancudomyces culisetae]|eukprot:OMH81298.1 hypothetical protein AX774_g5242 [Zancudomyces culisetae]
MKIDTLSVEEIEYKLGTRGLLQGYEVEEIKVCKSQKQSKESSEYMVVTKWVNVNVDEGGGAGAGAVVVVGYFNGVNWRLSEWTREIVISEQHGELQPDRDIESMFRLCDKNDNCYYRNGNGNGMLESWEEERVIEMRIELQQIRQVIEQKLRSKSEKCVDEWYIDKAMVEYIVKMVYKAGETTMAVIITRALEVLGYGVDQNENGNAIKKLIDNCGEGKEEKEEKEKECWLKEYLMPKLAIMMNK